MIDVLVFMDKDASLLRQEEIADELELAGLKIRARHASVGVIAGYANDSALLPGLHKIADVSGVHVQSIGPVVNSP